LEEIKRVYKFDVYKLAEELSDRIWYDFDKWQPFKAVVENPAQN
jgi:hypothetical protein